MGKAVIFDIKRFAIYDGPGIRTTIFFKGCSLDCAWCQNPESKLIRPQLFYNRKKCIDCNRCVKTCPIDKISGLKEDRFYDNIACPPDCEKCFDACPLEAVYKVGKAYEVEELASLVMKDIDFFKTSGGGVTLSGGEPLIQIDFIRTLLKVLKKYDINVIIETAGNVKWPDLRSIMRFVDKFYYDLKIIDEKEHIKYVGHNNRQILDNLVSLYRADNNIIIRIPLIPDITDTEKNLIDIIRFLKEKDLKNIPVELLPYNQLAETKFDKTGINCGSIGPYFRPGIRTQGKGFLRTRKKLFSDNGIMTKILSLE